MNWLYFLKLEPKDTFLRNTTIAALFVSVFGYKMYFFEPIIKNKRKFCEGCYTFA